MRENNCIAILQRKVSVKEEKNRGNLQKCLKAIKKNFRKILLESLIE